MSNGSERGTGGGRSSRVVLAVVVGALGIVAVAGILLAGPTRVGKPVWNGGGLPLPRITLPPHPASSAEPSTVQHTARPSVRLDVPLILLVLTILVLALIAWLLWRWLRHRPRREPAAPLTDRLLGDVETVVGDEPEADPAPAVARGIARALELLDEQRPPSDAIVAAWLGLQESAADSGVQRRPAETPAEYTTRLVGRLDADRDATGTLLRLYQDVRFGGRTASAADVATARDCLLRLRASWHDDGATTAAGGGR